LDRVPTVELLPQDPVNRPPASYVKQRHPGRVIAQFHHLWPALLAGAFQAGGYTGLVNLNPLCGLLAVLAVPLAARRLRPSHRRPGRAPASSWD
jgi:hypothetical protein